VLGIVSYGAYLPLWRLDRKAIRPGLRGEKAVAGFDEDSITMAVAAAMDCLQGFDRGSVEGLFFATTTPPYIEKQSAAIIANALDLRKDIFIADALACLRGGTISMRLGSDMVRAGSAGRVLITASDCRLGAPDSGLERESGDGAAAVLLEDSEDVVATIEETYSLSSELMDVWRLPGEEFVNLEEDRFIEEEGFLRVVENAVKNFMAQQGYKKADFSKVLLCAPNARCHRAIAEKLDLQPDQLQEGLYNEVGNLGTAYPLIMLASALDKAQPGDSILLAGYGDGSDIVMLRATERIGKVRRPRIKPYIDSKRVIEDYRRYAKWRGILAVDKGRSVLIPKPSLKELMRRQDETVRMHGSRCTACGAVAYPPQRVCAKCHVKDEFEAVRLSDKKGEIYSYTVDYAAGGMETPIVTMTNIQDGGRAFCILTDASPEDARVGLPVEFSFRKSYQDIIPEYIWKARPVRFAD
jgi:hydroxymethylglutaryl-CoA synthase